MFGREPLDEYVSTMRNFTKTLLALLLFAVSFGSAMGQSSAASQQAGTVRHGNVVQAEQHAALPMRSGLSALKSEEIAKRHPELPKYFTLGQFRHRTGIVPKAEAPGNILRATTPVEIWGNLVYSDDWSSASTKYGIYKFTVGNTYSLDTVHLDNRLFANGGGAIYDNEFHFINYSYGFWGDISAQYYMYDMDSWYGYGMGSERDAIRQICSDCTYDPTTGRVYGMFYDTSNGYISGDPKIFAWIDYFQHTRTDIKTENVLLRAIACNRNGQLYGLTNSGELVKVDKTTGDYTNVGATGITPGDYSQTMTFDMKHNKIYWAACLSNETSALYVIDPETAQTSQVFEFPHKEQWKALYIPTPPADDGAPAAATDLSAHFDGGSTSGIIGFDVPTTTFSGDPLLTGVTYYVLDNGDTLATGTAAAGDSVSAPVTAVKGERTFNVVLENNVGPSPIAQLQAWVGYDQPEAITKVTLELNEETGVANVHWNQPQKGVHGGYLAPDELTYDLLRLPDSVAVAGLTDTTYTETIAKGEMASYSYLVTPINHEMRGDSTFSNKAVFGDAFNVPYSENFDSKSDLDDFFTIIDANGDGSTWEYNWGGAAEYNYNSRHSGDDWLITPNINMKRGTIYSLTFNAKCGSRRYPERLAVAYGQGTDPSAYTVIMEPTTIANANDSVYAFKFSVNADGQYRVGFHALSDAGMYSLKVDDISITESSSLGAPDTVTSLTVTPAPQGALAATVAFTAPTKTQDGDPLASLTTIEVTRNDSVSVHTFTNPEPGASLTFTDETVENGWNKYTVVAYNASGNGEAVSASAFIGTDVPKNPTDITLKDNYDGTATLTWTEPGTVGRNGGYVDPTTLTYDVYDATGAKKDSAVTSTMKIYDLAQTGAQDLSYYGVMAVAPQGKSSIIPSNVVVSGQNWALPFRESFPNQVAQNDLWWEVRGGQSSVLVTDQLASDHDGGSVYYISAADEEDVLNTGKISLAGAANPVLVYSYFAVPDSNVVFNIEVDKATAGIDTISTVDYKQLTGVQGWRKSRLDFNAYKDLPYVIVRFHFKHAPYTPAVIDDINLRDELQYDLEADSIATPAKAVAGSDINVRMPIRNIGASAANGFTVELVNDNDSVLAEETVGSLAALVDTTCMFRLHIGATKAQSLTIRGRIVYASDLDDDNNETQSVTIPLSQPEYPTITDLSAQSTADGVGLGWTAPSTTTMTVTDDFENYESWLTDNVGNWTMVDGDGASTYGFSNYSFPHAGEPMSFIVFNPSKIGMTGDAYAANSGSQYMLCLASNGKPNSDWLITPELSGNTQAISFYANRLAGNYAEKMELLYSTTTTDTIAFRRASVKTVSDTGWQLFAQDIPAGAKYFAIHCISNDQFGLMIDDVTYQAASLTISGYNIYRDGKFIATVGADATSFTDTTAGDGAHVYTITIVYTVGESGFSNEATAVATAISNVEADKAFDNAARYNLSGQRVGKSFRGVVIKNGQKSIIK